MDERTSYENPHLRWIFASIRAYRAGRLDMLGLGMNLSGEVSAIEGDVPKPVRAALERLVNDLNVIYWTWNEDVDAEQAIARAEEVVTRYYPRSDSPDTP
jgi:hypothetical protein